jgi:hypothetical protein
MPPAPAGGGAAVAGGGPPGQQQQQPQRGGFLQGLIRMGIMWYMMRQFSSAPSKTATGPDGQKVSAITLTPMLPRGTPIDMYMYISENNNWKEVVASQEENPPIWVEKGIPLASGEPRYSTHVYRPSPAVQNNGSVYVHAVFTPFGASPNPEDEDYDSAFSWVKSTSLNRYLPKRRAEQGVNLLSGKNSTEDKPLDNETVKFNETVIISYLKPNMTVAFVDDFSSYQATKVPPHMINTIDIDVSTSKYRPHTWFHEFWLLRDYLIPVNETLAELPMHLAVEPIGPYKFAFFTQMEQSFSMQQSWGMSSTGESDEVKRIFLEGNPMFLALTMAVSMLHSLFDMLAFKNDIGFWKDNKSMKGLSARTIIINACCQLVIFLYLLDNETSFVVLMSTGVGTAIEFWKVTKAMDVSITHTAGGIPYVQFKDRASYVSSQTDKYDAEAMRYLSYALYPLVGGYAVYSLIYNTHKSWYSWILNSLVTSVYLFGFALMVPQLYLNYKLKSVAHLPWRQMTYKFLNTIIDDLFSFVVKMPLMHRLAVFRDDVVFLVYLYQRWIYRVDRTRVNEFGYQEEKVDGEEELVGASSSGAAAVVSDAGESNDETFESKKEK